LPAGEARASFGKEVNLLRQELVQLVKESTKQKVELAPIDVTAPFDINVPADKKPTLLPAENASVHPLSRELDTVINIFSRMGFTTIESRQIDDDYHMFTSLNFPEGHPARDDYDTFTTEEGLIAPAHTSTMQNRVLKKQFKPDLDDGKPIAVLLPGRVFRNEDLDARHEHTFYQFEGVYVDKGIHAGNLLATKHFCKSTTSRTSRLKASRFIFRLPSLVLSWRFRVHFAKRKAAMYAATPAG
jgi:phenylalanyl-tRNA synthetase alpha chain